MPLEPPPSSLHATLLTNLSQTLSLPISPTYLQNLLNTLPPQTLRNPLPSLQRTLQFRLLNSSITQSLSRSNPATLLPPDAQDPKIVERVLRGPVAVQIVGLRDVGRSKMSMVWDEEERVQLGGRGEKYRIVGLNPGESRGEDEEEDDGDGAWGEGAPLATRAADGDTDMDGVGVPQKSKGPHKLALQDAAGTAVYGFEMAPLPGVEMGVGLGCKMVLKNVVLARGLLLLDPSCVNVLGGKIEELDKEWRKSWFEDIKKELGYLGPDAI